MFAVLQANRSGWVPVKVPEGCDDEPGSPSPRSRSFTRIMESTVPMHCHLEVSLGLAVLAQKATLPFTTAAGDHKQTFARCRIQCIHRVDGQECCAQICSFFFDHVALCIEPSDPSRVRTIQRAFCYFPYPPAGASVTELSGDTISDDEEDEEAAQATPIHPGPALEVLLQDATLPGMGVNRLFALTISGDSDLMKAHHAAHDVTEISVGPWRAAPPGAGYLRVRDVSYTKKLNIPLPLAPEKCHVWEEHRLMVKEAGGWVVLITCKNDAPKGDCFEAQVRCVR